MSRKRIPSSTTNQMECSLFLPQVASKPYSPKAAEELVSISVASAPTTIRTGCGLYFRVWLIKDLRVDVGSFYFYLVSNIVHSRLCWPMAGGLHLWGFRLGLLGAWFQFGCFRTGSGHVRVDIGTIMQQLICILSPPKTENLVIFIYYFLMMSSEEV